jgi:hypothetical protein
MYIVKLEKLKKIQRARGINSGQGTYSGNLRFPEPLPFWDDKFLIEKIKNLFITLHAQKGRGSGNRRFPELVI